MGKSTLIHVTNHSRYMNKNDYIIDNEQYVLGKDKNGKVHYIKEIQDVVFPIVLEIDRIFRKHNIPYALAFGSCLGLYNYAGFIPWDDDIDLAFNYEDLPRIIEAFKQDLKPEFCFDCYETDVRYNILQPTFKVKNKVGPTMIDKNYRRMRDRIHSSDGFFVDMVALVGMKDDKTHLKLLQKSRRRLISYAIQDAVFNHDPLKLKAKMKADEKKYAEMYKDEPYVCQTPLLPFPPQKGNLLPREMVYPFREYDFNGHKLFSFNDVEGFLKFHYGEKGLKYFDGEKYIDRYPKEKRCIKHIKSFDFDK